VAKLTDAVKAMIVNDEIQIPKVCLSCDSAASGTINIPLKKSECKASLPTVQLSKYSQWAKSPKKQSAGVIWHCILSAELTKTHSYLKSIFLTLYPKRRHLGIYHLELYIIFRISRP